MVTSVKIKDVRVYLIMKMGHAGYPMFKAFHRVSSNGYVTSLTVSGWSADPNKVLKGPLDPNPKLTWFNPTDEYQYLRWVSEHESYKFREASKLILAWLERSNKREDYRIFHQLLYERNLAEAPMSRLELLVDGKEKAEYCLEDLTIREILKFVGDKVKDDRENSKKRKVCVEEDDGDRASG
jgi:hypothetical protein